MEFIELPAFTKRMKSRLGADEYRSLQIRLIDQPDIGVLIPGGGGLRKIRVRTRQRGKSGGVRVIYYWFVDESQIFFLDIYRKNEKSDLSPQQLSELVKLLKDIRQR